MLREDSVVAAALLTVERTEIVQQLQTSAMSSLLEPCARAETHACLSEPAFWRTHAHFSHHRVCISTVVGIVLLVEIRLVNTPEFASNQVLGQRLGIAVSVPHS